TSTVLQARKLNPIMHVSMLTFALPALNGCSKTSWFGALHATGKKPVSVPDVSVVAFCVAVAFRLKTSAVPVITWPGSISTVYSKQSGVTVTVSVDPRKATPSSFATQHGAPETLTGRSLAP